VAGQIFHSVASPPLQHLRK